ncbi:hypothetical protein A2U01_0090258 [Trifolium medium]|uniref:Uncharacterized protein n=1 Tax=Trifolium medium TaxID=97028 RepID=A0A392U837_9FABA|nr:hypothetical protein [Trifolium medium]
MLNRQTEQPVLMSVAGRRNGRRGRGARQLSPNIARLKFASDLFLLVIARPHRASSAGTGLFC